MPVCIGGRALDVSSVAHRDQHFRVSNQIFQLDLFDFIHNLRAAVVAIRLMNFLQLRSDHLFQLFVAGKNFAQLGDQIADRF